MMIKEQHQIIKILGILFSDDLKEAKMINWQKVLEKIKNHNSKLSQRYLTFSGKATILNTLILAKTTFLSNIFPIPQTYSQNYTNIFFPTFGKTKTLNLYQEKHYS